MSVRLIEAEHSNVLLRAMLDRYLIELSCYHDVALGATNPGSYPYLDAYWSEPGRHALLIARASGIVGFALIRLRARQEAVRTSLPSFSSSPRGSWRR